MRSKLDIMIGMCVVMFLCWMTEMPLHAQTPPAAVSGESLTKNLLTNPGFEEIHRTPPSATEAHRDATKLGAPVKWVRQEGKLESVKEARSGECGTRLEAVGGKEARMYSGSDTGRIRPGVSYVLSIWAKGKGELNLSVYQYDDANFIGSEFFHAQPPLRLTGEWQELRRVYTRPNDKVRKVGYSIYLNGEYAYIDDAWFGIDAATPVELLPNGGFERAFDEVMFEGWQLVAGGATLRDRQARTGERALRLTAQAEAAETRLAAMPPVYVNTAATYRLGAWGRGTGTLRLEVVEYDAAGVLLGRQTLGDKADVKLTDNWQQATATYRPVNPAARRAALTLVLAGVGAAATLDDASFGFVFKENPGVDPFEPPPAKDLSVTVVTRDAAATLYANGKPVTLVGAKGTIRLGEGVTTLAVETRATGERPGIRLAIAGQAETAGRWRVGAVEAGRARETAFNDTAWPVAATDSDGFAWAGDKQAKDVCFRQTLLWNDTYHGPDSCLFPKTREWGFSRGSFDHLGLMLYPPAPGATADYEFVLDVPQAFTLFGKQAPTPGTNAPVWGESNVRPASVAEEAVTRDGKPYRRYLLRFDAKQLSPTGGEGYAGKATTTYLPLRLESGFKDEQAAFHYRRQARGNVTELEQRIPVRILPAIAGRQPRRIMISGYADQLPFGSMLSSDHLEAVMDQAKAMGWNQAGLSIHDNWGKHFGDYWRGIGRQYAERGIRPMLSDGAQFPLQTSNTAGGSYRLTNPPLVNYVAATPAAQARWFKDSVKWDAKTRNTYCPTFMLGAGKEKFRELVGTVIADLQKLTPGAQVHLLDYEAHSWASADGTGSLCFCDRCKESFLQFAKLTATADLSDDAIFKNYHAQWDDFHVWQVMEVHKLVKEVDNELGLKLMAFTWGGWKPFEGRLKGRVDLYFAGTPGNDPASGVNQERMDAHARFLRGEQGMEQVMGQRFSFLRIGDRREPTVMSPDGLVDAQSWKSQVLRIVAALGGGVDLQASKECVAGMPYWIGEATRIIATYEDLFIDGERTDKLAESAQLKYPDLLVLKKGDERLVLLFNEGNADMKVKLRNRELKPEHKAQVFESGRWQDAGELEVVVPARDAVAVHIATRPSP
jgi:hypothetical protein